MRCAVGKCKQSNSKKTNISFYNFPKDAAQRKLWLKFCNQCKEINVDKAKICGLHFKKEDFQSNLKYEMGFSNRRAPKLKPGAIPTIDTSVINNEIATNDSVTNDSEIEMSNEFDVLNEAKIQVKLEIPDVIVADRFDNEIANESEVTNDSEIEMSNEFGVLNEAKSQVKLEIPDVIVEDRFDNEIANESEVTNDSEAKIQVKLEIPDVIVEDRFDKNTQTNNKEDSLQLYINTLEKKIEALRQENGMMKMLQSQSAITIKNLSRQVQSLRSANVNLEKALERLFTKGQIKKLKNGGKSKNFTETDIAQSITLYSASAKAYRLLRKKQFPLPSVRTLQRWSQKLDMTTGILRPVVKILSAKNEMSEKDKLCVLSFNEMKAKRKYCYDKTTDSLLAPVNNIQVALLRGLISNWKQPIYYDYDCLMSKAILFDILRAMKHCGFTIVAIVCDLGGGNIKLFNELEIDCNKPWFLYDDTKIYVFNDVTHLIKLLRNHFIDNGFIVYNKEVKKDIILNLLSLQSNDLKSTHNKISAHNLIVVGAERQKVKFAIKHFSHTIAQSITRAASSGYLSDQNWSECSQLLKLTNDWFNVMNSRVPRLDTTEGLNAYGLSLDIQNDILDNMSQMMSDIRVIGKNMLLPFQKGIIQSNNALKMLHIDLKNRYNISYILTCRLNQDVLENFFGVIRSKGGLHDHPDRLEFKYRLRSYILGHNEGVLSTNANVEVDNTPDLDVNTSLTGPILRSVNPNIQDNAEAEKCEKEFEDLKNDGLENLAEYICNRFKNENPNLVVNSLEGTSYTWVNHLSEGGLDKPSSALMETLKSCDAVFQKLNGEKLLLSSEYLKKHLLDAKDIQGNEQVKKLFFRSRMYFRMRSLNSQIAQNINSRKRKINKIKT